MKNFLLISGLLGFLMATAAQTQNVKERNLISVSATGEVQAEPDIATISVGVLTTERRAVEAYDKNSHTMEKVIAALKTAGIDKKDITTTAFSLDPQYDWSSGRERTLTGFQMTHTVLVKIRKLENAGAVLSKAADAGANNLGSISFTVDDPTKLESIARERAVKAARAKAAEMAKAAGVRLGMVARMAEGGRYSVPRSEGFRSAVMSEAAAAAPAPVESGSLAIRISVTIDYEIEQ